MLARGAGWNWPEFALLGLYEIDARDCRRARTSVLVSGVPPDLPPLLEWKQSEPGRQDIGWRRANGRFAEPAASPVQGELSGLFRRLARQRQVNPRPIRSALLGSEVSVVMMPPEELSMSPGRAVELSPTPIEVGAWAGSPTEFL